MTAAKIEPSPYTIVIDTREQLPYSFGLPLTSDRVVYNLQTVRGTLESGDYSLRGYERDIAVERKSLTDLFSTLGAGRARFQRELERLDRYTFAAVVVEAGWDEIINNPPRRSRLPPKSVFCSVLAWTQRFRNVHWFMMPGREMGEVTVARVLDRFWREMMRAAVMGASDISIQTTTTN